MKYRMVEVLTQQVGLGTLSNPMDLIAEKRPPIASTKYRENAVLGLTPA
jgi:hypothetical protein